LNDVLRERGDDGVCECIANARPYPIKGLYKLSDFPKPPNITPLSTGWSCLDRHLKLWQPEFMVITGIPTHGKSTWALNLAAQLAEVHGHKSVIASFEMEVHRVAEVLRKFHGGDDDTANAWINEHFTFIAQDPSDDDRIDCDWLIEKASDAVIRYGVQHFWLDPWNQVQHGRRKGESNVEYQERFIAELKRFGRAFGCSVYVVTHPTKDVKDARTGKPRTPGLYDIDGSAHWYNAADHGVIIDRPDISRNLVNVHVRKSRYRDGGVPGEAALQYDFRKWRYVPVDERENGDGRAA
jgi:twinkle protein